jgi:hypothetical protein
MKFLNRKTVFRFKKKSCCGSLVHILFSLIPEFLSVSASGLSTGGTMNTFLLLLLLVTGLAAAAPAGLLIVRVKMTICSRWSAYSQGQDNYLLPLACL